MSTVAPEEIAVAWIEKWSLPEGERTFEHPGNALDWELPRSDPNLCLAAILAVLVRIPVDPANEHFQVLAAGPMEDLLKNHGAALLPEIEKLARQRPAFRQLLGGVWQSSINPHVWEAVTRFRGQRW